ncbi:hypothetical protein SLA2020_356520 [Shorea laevis]
MSYYWRECRPWRNIKKSLASSGSFTSPEQTLHDRKHHMRSSGPEHPLAPPSTERPSQEGLGHIGKGQHHCSYRKIHSEEAQQSKPDNAAGANPSAVHDGTRSLEWPTPVSFTKTEPKD